MQTVDEELETIHVYVVRENDRKPPSPLPVILAVLCFLVIITVTVYSGNHPYYEHQTLRIPAQFLPLQTFSATEPIIPTGIKTYAATTAHGTLTITNGSIITQTIPQGFRLGNVITDRAVFVPAGSANGYGVATVRAHALIGGKSGNIPAYAVNQVVGSSIYIRNLTAFYGGRNAYSVTFATPKDRTTAISKARGRLTINSVGLHYPCNETINGAVTVAWRCQFVIFHLPAYMHVTGIKIQGKKLVVDVVFVARPIHIWVK